MTRSAWTIWRRAGAWRLPQTPKAVVNALAAHSNEEWSAWPSVETMASWVGSTPRAVQLALKWLQGVEPNPKRPGKHPPPSEALVLPVGRRGPRGQEVTVYQLQVELLDVYTPEPASPGEPASPPEAGSPPEPASPLPPKQVHQTPERGSPEPPIEPPRETSQQDPPTPPGGTGSGDEPRKRSKPRKARRRRPATADRKLVEDVWAALMVIRKSYQGGRGIGIESTFESATIRVQLGRRLVEGAKVGLTPYDGLSALVWAYCSRSINAKGARKTNDPVKSLLRRSHWVDYCQRAEVEGFEVPEELVEAIVGAELGHILPDSVHTRAEEAPDRELGPPLPPEALRRANRATEAILDAAESHVAIVAEDLDRWVAPVLDEALTELGGLGAVEEALAQGDYHAARAQVFGVASRFALDAVLLEEARQGGEVAAK